MTDTPLIDTVPASVPSINHFGLRHALKFVTWNREDIDRLRVLKDPHAMRLAQSYNDLAFAQLDVRKQNDFLACCKDYILRNLTITERVELERRYGVHEGETHG